MVALDANYEDAITLLNAAQSEQQRVTQAQSLDSPATIPVVAEPPPPTPAPMPAGAATLKAAPVTDKLRDQVESGLAQAGERITRAGKAITTEYTLQVTQRLASQQVFVVC